MHFGLAVGLGVGCLLQFGFFEPGKQRFVWVVVTTILGVVIGGK